MERLFFLISAVLVFSLQANSKDIVKHAPPGFDSLRTDITHGIIDTIFYESKTVGTFKIDNK